MRRGLFLLGVAAWGGVAALAVAMAEVGEPFWGFFPILAAVFVAWAVGEFVTDVLWREKEAKNA